jgi:protein involved in polysaccharide export with SLBB domain
MKIISNKGLRVVFSLAVLFCLSGFFSDRVSAAEEETANSTIVRPNRKEEVAYVIGPRNTIQIKIFGDASTHQLYRVDELGYINHALVGKVRLAGLTTSEAEKLMESRLDKDYIINPRVNVFVLQYSTFSIIGEVRKPGNYEITGQVSVIEAISMAGGFTAVANQRSVKIMRKAEGRESTVNVDTTRITQQGDRTADAYIEQDDVVVVPKSFF